MRSQSLLNLHTLQLIIKTAFLKKIDIIVRGHFILFTTLVASGRLTTVFHATIITQRTALIFSQIDQNIIQSRPPIGHFLFTFPLLWKNRFPFIINLPQCFTATNSAKLHCHVFSTVSHSKHIAGAKGLMHSFAMNIWCPNMF